MQRLMSTLRLNGMPMVASIGLMVLLFLGQASALETNNVVYEVFVRSFADGDNDSNRVGDLRGLISRLDYLNDGDRNTPGDLGVAILWLMPIFPSSTYHGYDVTSYTSIHPDYGTIEDFKKLVKEAHKRGMRILLDLPINHTSTQHEWFQTALKLPASPYRAYYRIDSKTNDCKASWHAITTEAGESLCYLGVFSPTMPDLDFNNPKVRQEIKAITKYWLDLGVDGFRLDAAKHIYGDSLEKIEEADILRTNDWWLEFSRFVYSHKPKAVLVGEVLGNNETLRRFSWGLDGLVDEPFMNDFRQHLHAPSTGFLASYKEALRAARDLNATAYKPSFPFPDQAFQFYPYLASHDRNPRLASELEKMHAEGKIQSLDGTYRTGMYLLLTLGIRPIIYQGDEVMQKGWKWDGKGDGSGIWDETLREPFPWYTSGEGPAQTKWFQSKYDKPNDGVSKEEQEQNGGMLDLVRALLKVRSSHIALATGDIGTIITDTAEWMVFERAQGQARYLVLINWTGNNLDYQFHQQWYPQYVKAKKVFMSDGVSKQWEDLTKQNQSIQSSITVPGYGLAILRKK
jgi:alpha-amylase